MKSVYAFDTNLLVSGTPTLELVQANQVTAVLSLSKKGAPEDVISWVTDHRHLPIKDGRGEQNQEYAEAGEVIDLWMRQGHRVLVHCLAGRNRSVTAVALYLKAKYGWSGRETMAHVRARRPNALHNRMFRKMVSEG